MDPLLLFLVCVPSVTKYCSYIVCVFRFIDWIATIPTCVCFNCRGVEGTLHAATYSLTQFGASDASIRSGSLSYYAVIRALCEGVINRRTVLFVVDASECCLAGGRRTSTAAEQLDQTKNNGAEGRCDFVAEGGKSRRQRHRMTTRSVVSVTN